LKNIFWVKLANVIIYVFIVLTIFAFVLLPFLVNKYIEFSEIQMQNASFLILFLYLTALPFAILLFSVKVLCRNMLCKEPFCKSSITALNVISICAFIDFLLYFVSTIVVLRNLLSLTLMITAFMVGLASFVLSQLVRYAMAIKQENDLTI
jgi:hypothetical protein